MKVTYWSDYACPYCYIGVTRLHKAIESLGAAEPVEVEMRAFELDPSAPREVVSATPERFARKYGLTLEQARERVEAISAMGRAEGIDFKYATTRNTNTFDAHRLTKLAHELGDTSVEDLLYHAYFVENLELANHEVLADVARQAGLPANRVAQVLASDEYADAVRDDERVAAALGIHGVPFFVIDDRLAISGCYPCDEMEHALHQALEQREGKRAQAQPSGAVVCGPDGCHEADEKSATPVGACGPDGCPAIDDKPAAAQGTCGPDGCAF